MNNRKILLSLGLIVAAIFLIVVLSITSSSRKHNDKISNDGNLKTTIIKSQKNDFSLVVEDEQFPFEGEELVIPIKIKGLANEKGKRIVGVAIKINNLPDTLKNPRMRTSSKEWSVISSDLEGDNITFAMNGVDSGGDAYLESYADDYIELVFDADGVFGQESVETFDLEAELVSDLDPGSSEASNVFEAIQIKVNPCNFYIKTLIADNVEEGDNVKVSWDIEGNLDDFDVINIGRIYPNGTLGDDQLFQEGDELFSNEVSHAELDFTAEGLGEDDYVLEMAACWLGAPINGSTVCHMKQVKLEIEEKVELKINSFSVDDVMEGEPVKVSWDIEGASKIRVFRIKDGYFYQLGGFYQVTDDYLHNVVDLETDLVGEIADFPYKVELEICDSLKGDADCEKEIVTVNVGASEDNGDCSDFGMDIVDDGVFNASDISKLEKIFIGSESGDEVDVNEDGKFTYSDVISLIQCNVCLWNWAECTN